MYKLIKLVKFYLFTIALYTLKNKACLHFNRKQALDNSNNTPV